MTDFKIFRKKYIINPKFQNLFFKRLLLLFVLISIASIGFSLYLEMKMAIIFKTFYENEVIDISSKFNNLAIMHLIFFIIISLIIFLWGLLISHKIAGPIYRLKMYFESISNNQPTVLLNFRKNDEFQDIAESFNKCILNLESKIKESKDCKKELIKNIENVLLLIDDEKTKKLLSDLITNSKIN